MPELIDRVKATTPEQATEQLDNSVTETTTTLVKCMGDRMGRAVMASVAGATSYGLWSMLDAMRRIGPPEDVDGVATALIEGSVRSWHNWIRSSYEMPDEAFTQLEKHLEIIAARVYYTLLEGISILRNPPAAEETSAETVH